MKINSVTTLSQHPRSGMSMSPSGSMRETAHAKNLESNKNQINTTIKKNSDGRASFKGGVPFLHAAANFASDNPLVMESLFAIIVTCALRPLTIMAMAKTDEDKEKCSYQAAKSISSGVVGLAMTAIVGTAIAAGTKLANGKGAFNMPEGMKQGCEDAVKKGVEALKNTAKTLTESGQEAELVKQIEKLTEGGKINLDKLGAHGKKAQEAFVKQIKEKAPETLEAVKDAMSSQKMLNNYSKTCKNVVDKIFQPVFMPLRAMVTIAMVPLILKVLGLSKPGSKPAEKKQEQNPMAMMNYRVFQTESEKELFGSFMKAVGHEN